LEDREEAVNEAVKYCQKHDILKEFLEIHGSEVLNMLLEGWTREEVLQVWREDAREDGLEEGRNERNIQIAKNALAEGLSHEFIQKITGLDIETIQQLG